MHLEEMHTALWRESVAFMAGQGVTRFVFRQKTSLRAICGIALLLAGAVLIVWVNPKS